MYRLMRALGFRLDPETAHTWALLMHRATGLLGRRSSPSAPVRVMGLEFPNVVGLAAGYDKDARAWRGLGRVGFGHIEVGTVTPQPQPGNPRPRLFRLEEHEALLNRLGFPSAGAETVAGRLQGRRTGPVVLGVSIGPNGFTTEDAAATDLERLIDQFAPLADYLAVNVSSPNTPGLRDLESKSGLSSLLARMVARRDAAARSLQKPVPLLVKLSPDLDEDGLAGAVDVIDGAGADGIILTNTTTSRPGVGGAFADEDGGLSGAPLGPLSLSALRLVKEITELPLVSVGGIMSADDAAQRLAAGASLVQVFTGFVYRGPALVRRIAALTPAE